jgi:hypothetical protein
MAQTPRSSPYQGLIPFTEEDTDYFFGREREIRLISANLFASRLTLLYGASGCGKTSVLQAGVIHQLRSREDLLMVPFKGWQGDPAKGLKAAITEAASNIAAEVPAPSDLPSLAGHLAFFADRLKRRLMIILDQFEEYFLYHLHEHGEGSFATEFPKAIARADTPVSFLLSLREDSLAKLDFFEGSIPNLFDNYLRIDHLDRKAARAAIEGPIEQYNREPETLGKAISIEPKLVEQVLDQVGTGKVSLREAGKGPITTDIKTSAAGDRIETPYLQLVMTRLWQKEIEDDSRLLRQKTLDDLGGAESIVKNHLVDVMNNLFPREKEAAAVAFYHLVTSSGTKIAHTVTDLAGYTNLPEDQLEPMLEKLSQSRILRPVPPPLDKPEAKRYEIFHDVLAPAVLDWETKYQAAKEQAEAVKQAAKEAAEQEREGARERELTQAKALAEEQYRRAEEKVMANKRLRQLIGIMAGMFLLVIAVLFILNFQAKKLRLQARALEKQGLFLKNQTNELKRANDLAQARLNRIVESITLKQTILSGKNIPKNYINSEIRFKVIAERLPWLAVGGQATYRFTISPEASSIPDGLQSVAFITYRMAHQTFRNSLLATGPDRNFSASYDGVGCLTYVVALIEYVDPDKPPSVVTFNMCDLLGW